jgi:hypothetical protein
MSDTDPKANEIPLPAGEFRAAMEAARGGQAVNICERLEDFLDDVLRKSCATKQFDQTAGNCEKGCQTVEEPRIVPCIHLRWGDGPQDHLETDDTEVLCITVCNPYSNVTLKDFTVQLVVLTSANNAVPNQPDGTPTVQVKPQFNICFGDIPACDPEKSNQNCISREVVLIDRGAIPGQYKLFVYYCFEACFTKFSFFDPAVFKLDLVAS